MADPAPTIILIGGTVTFVSEWYWKKELDWKVPLATLILAGAMEGMTKIDRNGATILALMIFAGAMTTKFGGHSPVEMLTGITNTARPKSGQVTKAQ